MWGRIKLPLWFLIFGGANLALAIHNMRRGRFILTVGKFPSQTVAGFFSTTEHPGYFWITVTGLAILGLATVIIGLALLARREPPIAVNSSRQLTAFGKFLFAYIFAVGFLYVAGGMLLSSVQHR